MTDWEFLIQREGDRGWRPIKTGNLQLTEGKYRIVASSNLLDTQIQTRVTYQTLGLPVPQRRARSCQQTTNPRGLLVIIPFTYLQSGMWQFVCSGDTNTPWHRILKLRVLAKTLPPSLRDGNRSLQIESPTRFDPHPPTDDRKPVRTVKISEPQFRQIEKNNDLPAPTEPLVPSSLLSERENWADGLDRLLEQLEVDSLQAQPKPPALSQTLPGTIQINPIVDLPSQLVSLDRSTFSGIIPGNRLIISGSCNLQLLKTSQIPTAKVEKISICLRHPQTSEIIVSIEQPLPPNLEIFAFSGRLELPTAPKVALLLGEVNLYDKHHIQLGSSGFTITLNLNPLHDSELSLLRLFDRDKDSAAAIDASAQNLHHQLTQELQLEAATISPQGSISSWHLDSSATDNPSGATAAKPSTIQSVSSPYPSVPLAYRHQSNPNLNPELARSQSSMTGDATSPAVVATPAQTHIAQDSGELENDLLDYLAASQPQPPHIVRPHPNLEIVIDD